MTEPVSTYQDLEKQLADITLQMAIMKSQERIEAIKLELKEISESTCKSIKEILGPDIFKDITKSSKGKSDNPVPAKYMSHDNPVKYWTGRGVNPTWVKSHIEKGGVKDDLLMTEEQVDAWKKDTNFIG